MANLAKKVREVKENDTEPGPAIRRAGPIPRERIQA